MEDIFVILLVLVAVFAAFMVAKFTDMFWKIKQQRQFMKKDFHLLGVVSKDRKAIKYQIFLPESSVIWNGMEMWTVLSNRIYRQAKPDDGFVLKEEHVKWIEGIPVLFVDEENFRPLDFWFDETTNAKPGEAGAILKSWVVNQAAKAAVKAFAEIMQLRNLIYIILALSLISAGVSVWNHMVLGDTQTAVNGIAVQVSEIHKIIVPPPVNTTNASAVGT
jgi:uncharacterized membrane protein YphA (DoxX/SURF4 family)